MDLPPSVISYGTNPTTNDSVEMQLMDRDVMLDILKHHLETDRNRMKKQADQKHRDVELWS